MNKVKTNTSHSISVCASACAYLWLFHIQTRTFWHAFKTWPNTRKNTIWFIHFLFLHFSLALSIFHGCLKHHEKKIQTKPNETKCVLDTIPNNVNTHTE